MEHLWEIPENDTVKINVACVVVQQPSIYGNTKSIGALMRDEHGGKVWGAMGPFNNFSEEQALMAGIQSACVYAQEHDLKVTHIETSHLDVFELIRLQEHVPIPEEQLEAFRLFNTVHANHYVEGETDHRISWIPEHMNEVAAYMAEYGLHHFSSFVEIPGPQTVGNLQFLLDRDMGMVIANPEVELLPNLGMGEIVDGPPPTPNHLKRRMASPSRGVAKLDTDLTFLNVGLFNGEDDSLSSWTIKSPTWEQDPPVFKVSPFKSAAAMFGDRGKGKAKMYDEYAFYDNGKLSMRAIEMLDSGALLHFSDVFGEKVLDLESHVSNGFFAKDILHYAVLDTLGMFEHMLEDKHPSVADIVSAKKIDLMPVNSVLSLMKFEEDPPHPSSKRSRRASSV
ncbi:hypothetical protein DCAR_0830671 [Daucus carota subsp. sativus]|uniref:Uncharacterized protein n=1 Tax=Daucus carota subsp. sativus TaxID=79200 RepID=A0A175YLA9_DAUCS|nr:hypothetical protein DCAR_0830671 [Daucus carota subsp. sativus]